MLEWYEAGKRQRKPLTESTLEAQVAVRKKTQTLEARSNGLTVVEDHGAKGKVALEAAVREYLEEVKLKRAHKTHLAYKRALDMLVSSNPGCDFVQDLERRNLMVHFTRAMKDAGLEPFAQSEGLGNSSASSTTRASTCHVEPDTHRLPCSNCRNPTSDRGQLESPELYGC